MFVCVLSFNRVDKVYVKIIPQSFVATLLSQNCEGIDPEGMANRCPLKVVTYLSAHKSPYAVVETENLAQLNGFSKPIILTYSMVQSPS